MKPEEIARKKIDNLLLSAGWAVQDIADVNLGACRGVAIREYPLRTGFADYLLFVDRKCSTISAAITSGGGDGGALAGGIGAD